MALFEIGRLLEDLISRQRELLKNRPMNSEPLLTADEFLAARHDLPDGGRWVELVAGRVEQLDPPDAVHGNVVLNLSKAIAEHLQARPSGQPGYAAFDVGVIVARNPDTLRFPAISYFVEGQPFAATDLQIAEQPPVLVVEIASTPARRRDPSRRVSEYHEGRIEWVWVADIAEKQVHQIRRGQPPRTCAAHELLTGDPLLPGFQLRVEDLFADPAWWK